MSAWILAAIFGWCGTGWPRHFFGGSGGGGFDPEFPWPPNCPVCGGIIGAISAIVINVLIGPSIVGDGFFAQAATFFAAGYAGNSLVGSVAGLARAK